MTNKEFRTDGVQLSIECGSLISDNLQSKKPIPTRMNCFVARKWHTESLTNQDENSNQKDIASVLGVAETILVLLLCCGLGIIQSLFNLIASFGDFTGLHI